MRVCVDVWGTKKECVRRCIQTYVTNDVDETEEILLTVPWRSPDLNAPEDNAFLACLHACGVTARLC